MKSWLKNLSNEYIHAEQNLNTRYLPPKLTLSQPKKITISPKFWLWRQVPEIWQVTRGFMLWFFLSKGIVNRIKGSKTKFGRNTSRNFVHPISHCAHSSNFRHKYFCISYCWKKFAAPFKFLKVPQSAATQFENHWHS